MNESKRRKFMKSVGISALATAALSIVPFKKTISEVKIENKSNEQKAISIHPSAVKRNK